jgi:predicted phosphodiesterase
VRTVVVSDLHLASGLEADLLRRAAPREVLFEAVDGADRVVLLGDVLELRDRPLREALDLAAPFFEELGAAIGPGRVVVVPGNHDYQLVSGWLDLRRLDEDEPLGLEHHIPAAQTPLARLAKRMGEAEVDVAYPGIWLRPDVYATHGHYLDRHLTIPTFERLGVAAVERILGMAPGGPDPLDPTEGAADPVTPDEYERAQAPVFAFLYALAQAGVRPHAGNPSARIWAAFGGGETRVARLRGWLLGSVVLPGAVGAANRLGLGPVRSDLSPGAITRAGIEAMREVVGRLRIEADWVIFGHTHSRGPLAGRPDWELDGGGRLLNTGSWVYSPDLIGETAARSAYWPGTIAVVEDDGTPELRHLLDDLSRDELAELAN